MFKTPEDRLSEIQLYELVAEELEQGEQSKGLWAKALAEGEGNIEKAKGLYIKLRVEMIKDEWASNERRRKRFDLKSSTNKINRSQQPSAASVERAQERIQQENAKDDQSLIIGIFSVVVCILILIPLTVWIAK